MWRDLLTLSRREQVGFITLAVILLVIIGLFFIQAPVDKQPPDEELIAWAETVRYSKEKTVKERFDTVFNFNPNTETVARLQLLGFSNYAIINLLKYREAGGMIKSADRLNRIYGVDSVLFNKLESYIDLENEVMTHSSGYKKPIRRERDSPEWEGRKLTKQARVEVVKAVERRVDAGASFEIEINAADTAMFALLKGVGPVLSARIVAYRKRLGGYCSIEQLKEVYGLSAAVVEKNRHLLSVNEGLLVPLDISRASLKRMKNHPYLDFYMAKDIYEVRKSGRLTSVLQFADSSSFAKVDLERLEKYFKVGENK